MDRFYATAPAEPQALAAANRPQSHAAFRASERLIARVGQLLEHETAGVSPALLADLHEAAQQLGSLATRTALYVDLDRDLALTYRRDATEDVAVATRSARRVLAAEARWVARAHRRERDLHLDLDEVDLAVPAHDLAMLCREALDNAFRYSEAGVPVTVRGSLTIDDDYRLSIVDEGVGIVGADTPVPAGLGLTLVRRLAQRYNAPLDVESAPGRGTRLSVDLPAADKEEPAAETSFTASDVDVSSYRVTEHVLRTRPAGEGPSTPSVYRIKRLFDRAS